MDYYRIAKKASLEIGSHAGLRYLQDLCRNTKKILDVGCGEGTRLNTLLSKNQAGYGIDPSVKAVKLANAQYPRFRVSKGFGENIPFKNGFFDLVYSAFSVEHCADPEKFITEMIRVAKPGGRIVFLAPNYGAPNRRSPNSRENPFNKFFEGLIKDLFPYPGLDWRRVVPEAVYDQIDSDTTFEPYVKSLIYFLKKRSLIIEKSSSLWPLEAKSSGIRKPVIRKLGESGISPFVYWGPQLFVYAKKSVQTTIPVSEGTTT